MPAPLVPCWLVGCWLWRAGCSYDRASIYFIIYDDYNHQKITNCHMLLTGKGQSPPGVIWESIDGSNVPQYSDSQSSPKVFSVLSCTHSLTVSKFSQTRLKAVELGKGGLGQWFNKLSIGHNISPMAWIWFNVVVEGQCEKKCSAGSALRAPGGAKKTYLRYNVKVTTCARALQSSMASVVWFCWKKRMCFRSSLNN